MDWKTARGVIWTAFVALLGYFSISYIAEPIRKNAEDIVNLKEEVSRLKTDAEWIKRELDKL